MKWKPTRSHRRWFAEDVAAAFEMRASGLELWAIATAFSTTVEVLGHVMSHAKREGFDAYPPRSHARVFRLLPPPAVSGKDSARFLSSLVLVA